jgi:hypothetical protein
LVIFADRDRASVPAASTIHPSRIIGLIAL